MWLLVVPSIENKGRLYQKVICEQRLARGEGIFAIRDCEQSAQCQSQSVQLRTSKSAVRPEQRQEGKQKLRSERQKGTMGPTNTRTIAFLQERWQVVREVTEEQR